MMTTFGSAATVACEKCSDSVHHSVQLLLQPQLLLLSLIAAVVKIDHVIPYSLDMIKINTKWKLYIYKSSVI